MLAEAPAPLMGEVIVDRIHGPEPLWVSFDPPFGPVPGTLWISSEWNGKTHLATDRYVVRRVSWQGPICDVTLERDPDKILLGAPGCDRAPFYTVSVIGESGWCTCRGYSLQADEPRRACKHIAAVSFVRAAGAFSNIERQVDDGSTVPGGRPADEPRGVGEGRQQAGGTPAAV